jgi:pimeloyl-ACP methyl ester carboxylesterase
MIDYRGYGNSQGRPSESGLQRDAQACLDYLLSRQDIDSSKLILLGASLGGAVAVSLAYDNPDKIRGLMLENTFTSIDDMVLVIMARLGVKRPGLFRWFLRIFVRSHWASKQRISSLRVPLLLLVGQKDELVPPTHSDELLEASAAANKQMYAVADGMHNNTNEHGGQPYYDAIATFITRVIS